MNTERLLELVSELSSDEEHFSVQQQLNQLTTRLQTLVANPQDANTQLLASQDMTDLRALLQEMVSTYSPAFLERMETIGALPFFTTNMADRLDVTMNANTMTPAVAQQDVQQLLQQRAEFLQHIGMVQTGLESLGFDEDGIEAGEAEIGFQIPRDIFQNELGGLAKELQELRQIIRAFSELAKCPGEPIEVRQISTTDPIFFLMVGLYTVKLLGEAVAWSLAQWKTVEEIRNLRVQTAALNAGPSTDKLVAQFDAVIKETIKSGVSAEVNRLLGPATKSAGRGNELRTYLEVALKGILARVERGMTVELRLGPPLAEAQNEDESKPAELSKEQVLYADIQRISNNLTFPKPSGAPIMALTRMPPANDQDEPVAQDDE